MRSIVALVLSSAALLTLASGCAATAQAPRSNPVLDQYSGVGTAPGGIQMPKRVTGTHPDRTPDDFL